MVLAEIEQETSKPIAELFDFIGGTSTGGILALGLTAPAEDGRPRYSADQLVELYETRGEDIFSRGPWHTLTALGNLLEEKYPATGVEAVLQEYFADTPLRDALADVMVTSYDIERRRPYFFKSHKARHDTDRDFPIWMAARATSAAPTYFEPAKVSHVGESDYMALIDGGVFANNPSLCSYVEARDLYPDEDILVVSLGTGESTREIPYDSARGWGLALWAQPLLGVVFDGVSDTVDYQLQLLCRDVDGIRRYFRFQTELTRSSDDMDDASVGNIRRLKHQAEDLLKEQHRELVQLCRALAE